MSIQTITWEELLEQYGGYPDIAARKHFEETREIHSGIPVDQLVELRDGAIHGEPFELAVKDRLEFYSW
jgi:hypothetical protein